MRVATFNTCHGTRGAGTPLDLEALVEACRGFEADLIALEEVDQHSPGRHDPNQAATVAAALGLSYVFAPGSRARGRVSGNALLTSGALHGVRVLPLRGRLRLGHRDRRNALIADVTIDGLTISTAVTHLSLDVPDNLPQQRLVVAALQARPGPRLLVGDLNRRTEWVRPEVERAGFTLATDDVRSAPRMRPMFRIDHVAVDGLEIRHVEIRDTGTSDHRALVAELAPLRPATATVAGSGGSAEPPR